MIESAETRRTERRYQAGRPYYRRPANKHQVSKKEDQLYFAFLCVFVGALIGATITLGALAV